MTSLIDVIFLLLLFFMLSSTFSRFAEVELQAGGTDGPGPDRPATLMFLRLTGAGATLNGQPVDVDGIASVLASQEQAGSVLISVSGDVTAQTLTDVLVALRPFPNFAVSVLEAS